MLSRLFLAAMLLVTGLYTLGVVLTTTRYFANRERQRRILNRAILVLLSIVVTVTVLGTIITVERH